MKKEKTALQNLLSQLRKLKERRVIGCIQVKGGAGRSTLATNLAGELSKTGQTVLIDCDMPQGTSASWYAIRQENGRSGNLIADTAENHTELLDRIDQYPNARYIVLDAPPRIAEITRAIVMLADLCLIPVGASKAEIWATTDVISIIDQAKLSKPDIDARMIWTRHRGHTNLAKELTEQARNELGFPILKTSLALRVAYPDALGSGLTVAEYSDTNARAEIAQLIDEVYDIVR